MAHQEMSLKESVPVGTILFDTMYTFNSDSYNSVQIKQEFTWLPFSASP